MIPISSAFRQKIDASSRYMIAEITLVMRDDAGNIAHTVVLTDEEISSFDLLEEITSNEELPFGGVSANEFAFSLDNIDKRFTPSNASGPYYGYLKPGVEVIARLGLEVATDVFEYVPLGIFYVAEWRAPSQDVTASITAYDKLFNLLEEPVPMLRVVENTTIKNLFTDLFLALDFTLPNILVDNRLNIPVPFGFAASGTVKDALDKLSEAGMCTVAITRSNQVAITSSIHTDSSSLEWTDDNQVITIDNPEKFNAIYGALSVAIHEPSLRRSSDLVSLSNLDLASGSVTLEKTQFSKMPVVTVESASLNNTKGSFVEEFNYGSDNMTILLNNPLTVKEVVTVVVKGVYCLFTKRELITNIPSINTKKQLNIDNDLIQTAAHAQKVTDVLLRYMTDPFALYEADARGNPALTTGDVITLSSEVDAISPTAIRIFRSTLRYDGSIEASIVGRKVI